eukprot:GILJ01009604.1.p1 GENE.GILJ01009604.1~~GILJ01009604.1.p1  ORF type:complete len:624 (-),score=63.37 GILJ01009604.1:169-2040(-)
MDTADRSRRETRTLATVQAQAVAKCVKVITMNRNQPSFLLQMATGMGKTKVAMQVIEKVVHSGEGRKVLFLVPECRYSDVLNKFRRYTHLRIRGLNDVARKRRKDNSDWDVTVASPGSACDAFDQANLIHGGEEFFCAFLHEAQRILWGTHVDDPLEQLIYHARSSVYLTDTPMGDDLDMKFSERERFCFSFGEAIEMGVLHDYRIVFMQVGSGGTALSVAQAISDVREHLQGSLVRTVAVYDTGSYRTESSATSGLYSKTYKIERGSTEISNSQAQEVRQGLAEAARDHPDGDRPKRFGTMLVCVHKDYPDLLGEVRRNLAKYDDRISTGASPKVYSCAKLEQMVKSMFGRNSYAGTISSRGAPKTIDHSVIACYATHHSAWIDSGAEVESLLLFPFASTASPLLIPGYLARCLRRVDVPADRVPEPQPSVPAAVAPVAPPHSSCSSSSSSSSRTLPEAKRRRVDPTSVTTREKSTADLESDIKEAMLAVRLAAQFEEAEAKDSGGFVYVMQHTSSTEKSIWHKVGKSVDVETRKQTLQTGSPIDLKIVGTFGRFEDALARERSIHNILYKEKFVCASNREWYLVKPDDVAAFLCRVEELAEQPATALERQEIGSRTEEKQN